MEQLISHSDSETARIKIAVKDVNFYYGSVQALTNINLQMRERCVTALIGPSGCGKSTFLRTINRMNELFTHSRTTGHVLIDSEDIYSPSIDKTTLRRKVGMVFQRPTPFAMSIFDNVAYGLRINGGVSGDDLRQRVEDSLRKAALWDEVKDSLHKPGQSLSGGQQQRLCIARSLAINPEIVLLDEPCSALDPISTAKIEQLIDKLKQDYTIVIVTHNMQQAARVSDDVGFFLNGELIEFATSSKMFTSPRDPRTEDYLTGRFG
ncbi:MAG TPA: phosphate ABC transporter ATP-binding protein PstB [Armatimonadota bacterium]|nr:phosphate ABC transporter ATP-binding protein PstB [Armatimonadota bacterium]